MNLTLADGQLLKAALLAQLERQSDLGDRDFLLTATRLVEPAFDEGVLRIGGWLLDIERGKPRLTFRMPPNRLAAQMYVAPVRRDEDGWKVDPVASGEVRVRTR